MAGWVPLVPSLVRARVASLDHVKIEPQALVAHHTPIKSATSSEGLPPPRLVRRVPGHG
jgi:hypothetical protein